MLRFTLFLFAVTLIISTRTTSQTIHVAPHSAKSNASDFLFITSQSTVTAQELQQVTYSSAMFLPIIRPLKSLTLNNFPISLSESGTLVLRRVRSAADANTILLTSGSKGDTPLPLPEVIVFRGTIEGEPHSKVTLCTVKDEIICSIRREDGTGYTLAPSTDNTSSVHFFVADKSMHPKNELLQCMTDETYFSMKNNLKVPPSALSSKTSTTLSKNLLEVRVAVECDTKFYKDFANDSSKAAAYAIALISLASITYEDEINTVLTIPWLKIWTENPADPYNVNGDGYALVWKAQKYWQDNLASVSRDLVHTLTSGGGGGIALQYPLSNGGGGTTICNKNDGFGSSSPFTFHSYPTFDFTYGVYIVAHEIGHNFGAVHSHNCFWNPPFDTCVVSEGISGKCFPDSLKVRPNPGSIMSYCPSVNLAANNNDFNYYRVNMTFLPRIASYMREQVESAACVTKSKEPGVVLSYPRGSESVDTTTISIRWQSVNIQNVKLEYSSDAGTTWIQITPSVPAADGQFTWNLPAINTDKMLVRISDVTDEEINDRSILPFKVRSTSVVSEEAINNSLELYPTVTDGQCMLEGDIFGNEQQLTLILYSLLGKEIRTWNFPVSAGHLALKLDIKDISAGVYTVQVRGLHFRYGKTIVRQ